MSGRNGGDCHVHVVNGGSGVFQLRLDLAEVNGCRRRPLHYPKGAQQPGAFNLEQGAFTRGYAA